jgi:hypothetical protein
LTLVDKFHNSLAGRACYLLRLVRGDPVGTPPHSSGKISMLAPEKALPILDYKVLKSFMKESEFVARKNTKQVAVEIPEDPTEVESSRVSGFREHVPQDRPEGARPISQHGRGGSTDLDRRGKVGGGEKHLSPSQSVLFLYGADEEDQSQQRT